MLPAPESSPTAVGALAALGIISAALYATGLALGAESLARTSFWLLYAEEDRYRLLARNMTDVITRHGRNGAVLFLSPAAEALFGTKVGELHGHRLFDRVHVTDRPAYLTALADAAASGDVRSVEFRVRREAPLTDGHAWLGPAAIGPAATRKTSGLTWQHQLTDEERRLRDLAYPLIEPPYDRNQWYSVLGDVGLLTPPWPYPDRSAYASRLFQTAYRSQTARYNQLIEDVRNDVVRIEPFYATANYVADMPAAAPITPTAARS